MNREEIIRMAYQAMVICGDGTCSHEPTANLVPALERFATLVADTEREACANVAKAISDKYAFGYYGQEVDTADEIEAAIRARGTP